VEGVGGRAVPVPVNAKQEHDLEAMASKVSGKTSVVYVANPNNPTGTVVDPAALAEFVKESRQRPSCCWMKRISTSRTTNAGRTLVGLVNEDRNLLVARHLFQDLRPGRHAHRLRRHVAEIAAQLRNYGLGTLTSPSIAAGGRQPEGRGLRRGDAGEDRG